MTCYIIDDEPLAIEVLKSHIETYGQIELKGTFQNPVVAFQAIQQDPVDLIFLDIQMPKLTGLDFIRAMNQSPLVILTTAYREYALSGFELDVVDYLLKPISLDRFLKAVGKANRIRQKPKDPESGSSADSFLLIQKDKVNHKLYFKDILYVESQRDYSKIVTESKEISVLMKISDLEVKLKENGFLRIHRSFIASIHRIEGWSSCMVNVSGHNLPIGRTYYKEVMDRMKTEN